MTFGRCKISGGEGIGDSVEVREPVQLVKAEFWGWENRNLEDDRLMM